MNKKRHVFISYSSKDRNKIKKLIKLIEEAGYLCWRAPEQIPPGSSYAKEIPKAIRECDVFLLILSQYAQESIWVEKEIDCAVLNHKVIIPLQMDETPMNETLRFYLNNVQMIPYWDQPEYAMDELIKQLTHHIGTRNKKATEDQANRQQYSEGIADSATNANISNEKKSIPGLKRGNTGILSNGKRDSNALRLNRIPLECNTCGGKHLRLISLGTYACENCGANNYDDFQKIRQYLRAVGNASAVTIEKNTGVPRRVVDYYFQQEYLEIPASSSVRLPCKLCGAPIRTGIYCEECKKKQDNAVKDAMPTKKQGVWHSHR